MSLIISSYLWEGCGGGGGGISCQIVGRSGRPLPMRAVLVLITIVSVSVVISAYIILSSCLSNHSLLTSTLPPWPASHPLSRLSLSRIHQLIKIVGKAEKKLRKCVELRINGPFPAPSQCTGHCMESCWVYFEFDNLKQLSFLTSNEGQSPGHWYNVSTNNRW